MTLTNEMHYVLDTNVLLDDAEAIHAFPRVILPFVVIEELDRLKTDPEIGHAARRVLRTLEELRSRGDLTSGSDSSGLVRVVSPRDFLGLKAADDQVLQVALDSAERVPTTLVTQDLALRLRGQVCGVRVQGYEERKQEGAVEVEVSASEIREFHERGYDFVSMPNEMVILRDREDRSHAAYGRGTGTRVEPVRRRGVWGIHPRNKEQAVALDLLLDDSVPLVSLMGAAGTGKTLCSLAAGLQKVVEEAVYSRLLVSRPVMPLGKDIGYLPGTLEEKMDPWMQPIYDNLEVLGQKRGNSQLVDLGLVQVEPLTYIRGRSLPNQFMIVDEAQNLTPLEVKTIVTRAGEGTKIVLTGDPAQIDHARLSARTNGLSVTVNRMRGERIAGHVWLTKGERSQLAEVASRLL